MLIVYSHESMGDAISVVPGHISGIVLLGLFRGKGTPGMFDPVL